MPTEDELRQMLAAILAHAFTDKADRQRCAVKFLFEETIRRGSLRTPIEGAQIDERCPGKADAKDPKAALRRLMSDIKGKLTAFFNNHAEAYKLPYSVSFQGDGNFLLVFERMTPRPVQADFVPVFWKPYFMSPMSVNALILYPEPQFFVDREGTYFRNPSANISTDRHVFSYLQVPGTLETSYSFVPAGIVQAMLCIMDKLREYEKDREHFPAGTAIKPSTTTPPEKDNLILLATPTSSPLTETLEAGMPMQTTRDGVYYDRPEPYGDTSVPQGKSVVMVKWGVVTRKPQGLRTVTVLSAKHGRTVEAMAKFVTAHSQLATLAQKLQRVNAFPERFQALFRVRMVKTPEGPFSDEAHLEKVVIPEIEEGNDSAPGLEPIG
jgi:hypothetical protein